MEPTQLASFWGIISPLVNLHQVEKDTLPAPAGPSLPTAMQELSQKLVRNQQLNLVLVGIKQMLISGLSLLSCTNTQAGNPMKIRSYINQSAPTSYKTSQF